MPQAIPVIITVAKVAMTAYSAVSAVKALKDGNIMGAVMGGVGAFVGASSLGAFSSAAAPAASSQGAMLAEQTAAFGAEGAGMTAQALGDSAVSAGVMGDYAVQAADMAGQVAPSVAETTKIEPVNAKIQAEPSLVERMGDTFSGSVDSVLQGAKDMGNKIFGQLQSQGDGTFVDTGSGNIFDEAGNLIKKVGMDNIVKGGQAVAGYLAKNKENEDKKEAAKEGREYMERTAAQQRARVGAATSYVPPSLLA